MGVPSATHWTCLFQSSPARGGGCNAHASKLGVQPVFGFQSSPARGGGCNAQGAEAGACDTEVSILTRPWGRVQRFQPTHIIPHRGRVSILTRPWGRVQRYPAYPYYTTSRIGFNPHPPVGAGATRQYRYSELEIVPFQSSPARGGGCNLSQSVSCPPHGSFNPHPPVGAGATDARRMDIQHA